MHPFRWLYRVVNSETECADALGRHDTTVITLRFGRSKSGCRWPFRIATVVAFIPLLGIPGHPNDRSAMTYLTSKVNGNENFFGDLTPPGITIDASGGGPGIRM